MANKEPKEWIERLDNPELSESELFNLEMEADFYSRYDLMDAYRESECCDPDPSEFEED